MAALANSDCNQYLCFTLAGETYAFRITGVREVTFAKSITPLPTTCDFVAGVINLRGSVIPVIDLRKRFSLEIAPPGDKTTIVIIELICDDGTKLIGTIVDDVCGVAVFPELEICESPDIGLRIEPELVQGITSRDDRTVVILNVAQMFERNTLWATNAK